MPYTELAFGLYFGLKQHDKVMVTRTRQLRIASRSNIGNHIFGLFRLETLARIRLLFPQFRDMLKNAIVAPHSRNHLRDVLSEQAFAPLFAEPYTGSFYLGRIYFRVFRDLKQRYVTAASILYAEMFYPCVRES